MTRIPVTVAEGQVATLSPGGQNILIEQLIHEFAPRFTPGGQILYIGDTDEKLAFFDPQMLAALGVEVQAHGKMPDRPGIHYSILDAEGSGHLFEPPRIGN